MSDNDAGSSRFKPGNSGNPGGRPKIIAEIQKLAREHTATAMTALADIVADKKATPAARVAAATAILDRGYGRPPQFIAATTLNKPAAELTDEELMAIAAGAGEQEDEDGDG